MHSMTAFYHHSYRLQTPSITGHLNIELRSVNHRYLELSFKLSDELRWLENSLRPRLAPLERGKVECRLSWTQEHNALTAPSFDYNQEALNALKKTLSSMQSECPHSPWPDLHTLLQTPGILIMPSNASSASQPLSLLLSDEPALDSALEDAIQHMQHMRYEEGERIRTVLTQAIERARTILTPLHEQATQLTRLYQQRLHERLEACKLELDSERLLQEAVTQALRSDVKEELDRLKIHLDAVEQALTKKGAVGKQLDFLMQELNREANTLASKAADIHISHAAVELKLCIEQMREQIQNIV